MFILIPHPRQALALYESLRGRFTVAYMPYTPSSAQFVLHVHEVDEKHLKFRKLIGEAESLDAVVEMLREFVPPTLDLLERIYAVHAVIDLSLLLIYREVPHEKIIVLPRLRTRRGKTQCDEEAYRFIRRFMDVDAFFKELDKSCGREGVTVLERNVAVVDPRRLPLYFGGGT